MKFPLEQIFFMSPLLVLGFSIILNLLIIIIKRNFFLSFINTIFSLICSLYFFYHFINFRVLNSINFLYFDNLNSFYLVLFISSSIFTCFLSYFWLKNIKFNKEEFYLLLLISNMGGYLLFLSKDLFTVFIGIELLSFPLFGMIGYFSFKNEINLEASFKYFIISIISSIFLLFGLSLIYLSSGNLSFFLLQSMNFLSHSYKFNLVFLFGIAILYISFFIKFSVFPFYIWISDIYAGTSFVVLTYFSNAIKIVLFFLILKFFSIFSYVHLSFSYFLLKLIIIFSIFFGSILSLFQDNFKRFIGYSSITHSGYLMIPLIFLNSGDLSLEVVKISLLAYFLNSIVLFSSMYLISLSLNKNKRYFIKNYEGIFWESPILSISIMISCFSMIGIPLTIGFFGKFFLLRCLVQENQVFLILSVFFGSIVSLYYYFNFIKKFFYKSRINSYKNVFFQKKIYIFYKIFIFLLSLAIIFCGCNLKILKFLMFNF